MPSLDYATVYETQVRPAQRRRRALLGLSTLLVLVLPVMVVGLSSLH